MKFEWIDFYSEFATKLLLFKNDRKALIERINDVYTAINMQVPKLESGGDIIDIDPFTITYNTLCNTNGIALCSSRSESFASGGYCIRF